MIDLHVNPKNKVLLLKSFIFRVCVQRKTQALDGFLAAVLTQLDAEEPDVDGIT